MVQGEDFGTRAKGNTPSLDVDGKPVVIAGPCVLNREIKSWTPQDSLPPMDKFAFCVQGFGNLAQDPTASKVVAQWGLIG